MKRIVLILSMLAALLGVASIDAQQQFPTLERGLQPEKLYHFAGIDNINVFNGNLTIVLPIGLAYPLDGGLSYQLLLSYNSNLWDWHQSSGPYGDGSVITVADPAQRSNAGTGWILGFGSYVPTSDPYTNSFEDVYAAADGGDHRFDKSNSGEPYVKYTTDGSNLRLRKVSAISTVAWIDFPDGTIQKHEKNSEGHWDLREILAPRGTATVHIDPLATRPAQCSSVTDSWTKISDGIRIHYLCFNDYEVDGVDTPMIETVVLDGPQNQTSTFLFAYNTFNVTHPAGETVLDCCTNSYHRITALKSITLPDGSSFKFEHWPDRSATTPTEPELLSVTLPTGGRIEYDYAHFYDLVPPMALCTRSYRSTPGVPQFGVPPIMITNRTVKTAPFAGGAPESYAWTYWWTKTLSAPPSTCMSVNGPIAIPDAVPDEVIGVVTDPSGNRTEAHFSVWPGDMVSNSARGFQGLHYGFPYGLYDAGQNRYLSTERFQCSGSQCTKLLSTYVRHDLEMRAQPNPSVPNVAMPIHRLASHRTYYHDDPANCVATGTTNLCRSVGIENSDWDGFGHYRKIQTSDDFGKGGSRTVTTDWNKPGGVQRVIGAGDAWTLDEYENRMVSENDFSVREQACFAAVPGNTLQRFRRATRSLKGSTPAATDLLTLWSLEGGNLQKEQYFGGDATPLPSSVASQENLCQALGSLSTAAYEIAHTWQNGVLATSQYTGVSFLSLDRTIDPSGVVTESRDVSLLATKFSYDSSGRLKTVEPPGSAITTYSYSNATKSGANLVSPAKVAIQTGTGPVESTVKREYLYDTLGRLWREKQLMPDDRWSVRETLYDEMGRPASTSEMVALPATGSEFSFSPAVKTLYENYDAFGRIGKITVPDGSVTTFSYVGDRLKTRTAGIWTGVDANGQPATEDTPVSVVEEYDGHGRLISTTEKSGPTSATSPIGAAVRTEYAYDAGDHLTEVVMNRSTAGPVQRRIFDYDSRGFLRWESQPETGITAYAYDARGHVVSQTRTPANTQFDLTYIYDSAERLTRIDGRNPFYDPTDPDQPEFRVFKQFSFGTVNSGTNLRRGKLMEAVRYNYPSRFEPYFKVKDVYEYGDLAGRLTKRTTYISRGLPSYPEMSLLKSITVSTAYNDLGLPTTVTYPMCEDCGFSGGSVDRSGESRFYNNGRLSSVAGFVSNVSYWPNGMRHVLVHENGVADTQTVGTMARPTQISFGHYDHCVQPKITLQPGNMTSPSAGSQVSLTVSAMGTASLTYSWYSWTTNPIAKTLVGSTPTITVTPQTTTSYQVEITNQCGYVMSQTAEVKVGVGCTPPSTGAITAVTQPDGSWVLTPNPQAQVSRTYQWKRLSDNQFLGTAETQAVGVLAQTTTFSLTIVDSCGTTTSNVTIMVPLSMATTGLVATANTSYTNITVTWPSVSGAAAYEVWRRSANGWEIVSTPTTASFTDTQVVAGHTYAYRVLATATDGNRSNFSNTNIATTRDFPAVEAGQPITDDVPANVLTAVNLVREAAGWPAVTWENILPPSDPVVAEGNVVTSRQLLACRSRLNEALLALGAPAPTYTDADVTAGLIKAVHLQQILDALK